MNNGPRNIELPLVDTAPLIGSEGSHLAEIYKAIIKRFGSTTL